MGAAIPNANLTPPPLLKPSVSPDMTLSSCASSVPRTCPPLPARSSKPVRPMRPAASSPAVLNLHHVPLLLAGLALVAMLGAAHISRHWPYVSRDECHSHVADPRREGCLKAPWLNAFATVDLTTLWADAPSSIEHFSLRVADHQVFFSRDVCESADATLPSRRSCDALHFTHRGRVFHVYRPTFHP